MMIGGTEFSIGSDPEVFVQDCKTKQFVCAYGLVDGTKAAPQLLSIVVDAQVDGMALEFNTYPAKTSLDFSDRVCEGKFLLGQITKQHDCRVVVQSTVEFSEDVWAVAPDSSKVLGCEEDYNAWTMGVNERPDANVTFRTGGGHVHIGWGRRIEICDRFREVCAGFTREMDATNGVASVLYDGDVKRRKLYGRAGAFRPKPYGVEYRTLSNSWVRCKALSNYVAARTFQAARNMMRGKLLQTPEVESIINDNKMEEAKYFLRHNKIPLPPAKYRVV